MTPVNPSAQPPAVVADPPANPAPVRPAPVPNGTGAREGFTPGVDAPRATPRPSDLITGGAPPGRPAAEARSAPSAAGARSGVSLRQLSAYAGLVMEADNPVAPPGAGQGSAPGTAHGAAPGTASGTAPGRNAPASRPLRPGSILDVTA